MPELLVDQAQIDQMALCTGLAPEVVDLTRAYYAPPAANTLHPFLNSPYSGGILQHVETGEETQRVRVFHATPLVATAPHLSPDRLIAWGLPEEVREGSIVWGIDTESIGFPRGGVFRSNDIVHYGRSDHSYAYWDGGAWHIVREVDPRHLRHRETACETSSLRSEEILALRALAKQARGLHYVAEVYDGNAEQFVADMEELPVDDETRRFLNVAFATTMAMVHEVALTLNRHAPGFLEYYGTGYQRVNQLVERIHEGDADAPLSSPRHRGPAEIAVGEMYQGAASLDIRAVREREQQAREAGRPYPLPATW